MSVKFNQGVHLCSYGSIASQLTAPTIDSSSLGGNRNHGTPFPCVKVESKQLVLESSKRELEDEKGLLERGRRDAAGEAEKLDERREVSSRWSRGFGPQFARRLVVWRGLHSPCRRLWYVKKGW